MLQTSPMNATQVKININNILFMFYQFYPLTSFSYIKTGRVTNFPSSQKILVTMAMPSQNAWHGTHVQ